MELNCCAIGLFRPCHALCVAWLDTKQFSLDLASSAFTIFSSSFSPQICFLKDLFAKLVVDIGVTICITTTCTLYFKSADARRGHFCTRLFPPPTLTNRHFREETVLLLMSTGNHRVKDSENFKKKR